MGAREKLKSYFERIREKHKLTFMDETLYQEKWSYRISTMNMLSLLALYSIILIVLVVVVIRYTPLNQMFGYKTDDETTSIIEAQSENIDSLQAITDSRQMYLDDLEKILKDEPFDDSLKMPATDSLMENYKPDFSKVKEDSILREKFENEGQFVETSRDGGYEFFFRPVNGKVSRSFNSKKQHYGVDVVTDKNHAIKSCLDGTIVMVGNQTSEGKIVVVQHDNELLSVYKHCSYIMKKQGDKVQSGDPIAIVGNTGEKTSGPHLHFELWKEGQAVNPEDFITF